MRRNAKREKRIITGLTLIIIGSFAGMIALGLGGCAEEEDNPVPQENADTDLVPDPDNGATPRAAEQDETGGLDPNPVAGLLQPLSFTPQALTGYHYDRAKALDYVRRYALYPNPQTAYCSAYDLVTRTWIHEDCTNFASQVLWYGGLPMAYTGSANSGWWYANGCTDAGSSKSWRQVNGLVSYLVADSRRGEFYQRARDLKIGDLIFYRLRRPETGYRCDVSNLFNHTTVVSGFDANGEPLVSYHSNERFGAPWNANNHSGQSLGEACAVGFVHIKD